MPLVAIVISDPGLRLEAVQAFDAAPPDWDIELHESPPENAAVVVTDSDDHQGDHRVVRFDRRLGVDLLDLIRERAEGTRSVIRVCGTGGGVGVTSVALHLAAELARQAPVAYVDLIGDATSRLGLDEVEGLDPGEEGVPVAGGMRLFVTAPARLDRLLSAFGDRFDRVIVDAGTDPFREGEKGVLVCPPTVGGIERARRALESSVEVESAIVTNRLGRGGRLDRQMLERVLGVPISLELPCCPALRDAEDARALVRSPLWRWRRGIARLARALCG